MTPHRIFFWILLALLPTQLGLHFWPDWAMVLGRRVDYLSPTLYLTDILVFGMLLFWQKKTLLSILYSRFSILVLLFAATNIYFADNQPVAVYKWLKVLEFAVLGWYIVKTKPRLDTIVFPLSIGVLYSSVLAIAQFFLQHSVGGPLWWLGERTFAVDTPGIARISWFGREILRPYATFPHPNVLGGFLAVLLPLLVARKKWLIVLLGATALLLTFSRSAIVVGGIGILFAFRKKMPSFIMVIGVVIFFILCSPFSILNSREESLIVRQQLNDAAIKLWQQSPLIGVGLGNFLVKLPEVLPSRSVYFLQPAHNIYLLLLSEVGIVGFLFFVWLLLKTFRLPFSIYHLSFIILLTLGFIDHYPLTLQQGQLLLTILVTLCIRGSSRVRYRSNS